MALRTLRSLTEAPRKRGSAGALSVCSASRPSITAREMALGTRTSPGGPVRFRAAAGISSPLRSSARRSTTRSAASRSIAAATIVSRSAPSSGSPAILRATSSSRESRSPMPAAPGGSAAYCPPVTGSGTWRTISPAGVTSARVVTGAWSVNDAPPRVRMSPSPARAASMAAPFSSVPLELPRSRTSTPAS
jgi:hypothetical protein